jgi:hypothetical protein
MTDVNRSRLTASAFGATGGFRTPSFGWRCEGEDIELIIAADEFLNSGDPVMVQYRLDDRPAGEPQRWSVSTTGTGVFAPDRILVELTESAMESERLRVRLTDYQGTPHDLEFDLSGLASGFQRLPCGLEPAKARLAARRARQAAAARAADSVRELEERIARFWEEHPFIGNPDQKLYAPTTRACWRLIADSATGVFFTSREEAELLGYSTSVLCRIR